MDNHFITLRRKLSILATVIVFFITLLVGSGFLSYQYWRGYESSIAKADAYRTDVSKLNLVGKDLEKLKDDPAYSELFKNFFLLFDGSGSVPYNHSPYTDEGDWTRLLRGIGNGGSMEDDGYLFSRFRLDDGKEFVSIIFMPYSTEDFTRDMAEYAGFVLILSILIYFVISRFIAYVLKPVEENMKTMKYFVTVAGHELKTPLASILSSVQLLSETKEYDAETVHDIESETKKAGELIGSLAELSSLSERAPREEVHLSEAVHETLKDLDSRVREKNLEVKTELREDVTVFANRYYVLILVSNLLSNAVKYTPEGGKVRIKIGDGRLRVSDTGIGIPKGQIPKIFDVFHRVSHHRERSDGLGLGLALVKRIVMLYGWKVSVHSEEGNGSEFEVRFTS